MSSFHIISSSLSCCMFRVDHPASPSRPPTLASKKRRPATQEMEPPDSMIQEMEGLVLRVDQLEERIASKSSVAYFVPCMRLREVLEQSKVLPRTSEEAELQQRSKRKLGM